MFRFIAHLDRRYIAALAGLALLLGAAPLIPTYSVKQMLREDAKFSALQWAGYLVAALPDLPKILRTGEMDHHSMHMLTARSPGSGGVFRSKLFNSRGKLLTDTETTVREDARSKHHKHTIKPGRAHDHSNHDRIAVEVFKSGKPRLFSLQGDGKRRPLYYSEAYVPVQVGGKTIGVMEIYVDQTVRREILMASLYKLMLTILGIALLAFVLPAGTLLYGLCQEKKQTKAKLEHVTHHDMLTGIVNRHVFKELVEARLRAGQRLAVHFLDLDNFKNINDLRGHETGDLLLKGVSDRLREIAGENGLVGRYGGDEFIVCYPLDDEKSPRKIAETIVEAMQRPFTLGDHDVQIGASVGYANSEFDGETAADLIKAADIAMYKAKSDGRGRAIAYEPKLEKLRRERAAIEQILRGALAEDRFELHFQPLFKASEPELIGFEALLRLHDYNGNLLQPVKFISVAEEMGLMDEIGAWVVNEACRNAALWPDHLKVSVNLSATQFASGSIVPIVTNALAVSKIDPGRLQLEVTESVLIIDAEGALAQLNHLRDLGVSLSLDDFGTGFSSLNYIWRYPFHNIKIDKSFVAELEGGDEKATDVLRTIVGLGGTLGLSITAEGAETTGQAALLYKLRCDYLQGYLLGKPLPVAALPAFLLNASWEELDWGQLDKGKTPAPHARQVA